MDTDETQILENKTSVFNALPAEVNEIANVDAGATRFIQKLGFVRRLINGICLPCHNNFIGYQQVGGVIADDDSFELNLNLCFKLHFYASCLQLYLHGALINLLQKPKTENVVNFKSRADQLL